MATLFRPPPGQRTGSKRKYGNYCIKATSRIMNNSGKLHINVVGYDTDISIGNRVEKVASKKSHTLDMTNTDVEIVFLAETSLEADGTIFMTYADNGTIISIPPGNFNK
jgi:hypothetical protein